MKRTSLFVAIFCVVTFQSAYAGPIVIAGSSMESPPPFWEDSFWGMTPTIDRAFPFTIISGGPYYAEQLQVAAYHYSGMPGSSGCFSISLDQSGHPGNPIAAFEITGITTAQTVLTAELTYDTILYPETPYWLVGETPQGQVNWNLADNIFGTAAYRTGEDDWVILPHTNVSAFAILGSPVPEPCTLSLLALASLTLISCRKPSRP